MPNYTDVLIVDDNQYQLNYLTRLFIANGISSHIVNDSQDTIKQIEKQNPKVIVLDLMMPKMDGFSIIKTIRKDYDFSFLPIIVYSGKTFDIDKRKVLALGANKFFPKPTKGSVLVDEIKKYL